MPAGEALVLGVDTSGPWCSAALVSGGTTRHAVHVGMARGQAEALLPLLEDLLAAAGAGWRDLDALGVGVGPGNFTGIRIGVAAIRGLALGLGIPAAGATAFEALAFGIAGPVLASIDARRGFVHLHHPGEAAARPLTLPRQDLPPGLARPGLRVAGAFAEEIAAGLGAGVAASPLAPGDAVARIAAARWRSVTAPPAPVYMRPPDAAPAAGLEPAAGPEPDAGGGA